MSIGRRTTDTDRRGLKIATQRTVQMCGGQDYSATVTRVHSKTLSDYGNTGNERHGDTFMPVDVFADLVIDCAERGEVAPMLERLCELAGGRFVRVHGDGLLAITEEIMRQAKALQDHVSNGEAAE
ncbi:hypothetical protein FIV00_14935 [Labrenzia sp. THAF82]|uniref:hypothetical protein n=1 Tax=Labrenzia sp. THAF82 TaxID=2587861 RepID=UPI001267EE8D|nr:hypothetical protein [Labrenzia sp. THAF82]QFT31785.1 hypothetical protein FIV00_14935 [Labrenzia sp. THAF82]